MGSAASIAPRLHQQVARQIQTDFRIQIGPIWLASSGKSTPLRRLPDPRAARRIRLREARRLMQLYGGARAFLGSEQETAPERGCAAVQGRLMHLVKGPVDKAGKQTFDEEIAAD